MLHYIDRMELPKWYDENLMLMMVVNPNTAFTYWELSFGQCRALSGWKPVLKLYKLSPDQDGNPESQLVRTVSLPPFTENWYFYDLQPRGVYQAEISWEQDEYHYVVIKSNIVTLPPVDPLNVPADIKWRKIMGVNAKAGSEKTVTTTGVIPARDKKVQRSFENMPFYMGIKTAANHGKGD